MNNQEQFNKIGEAWAQQNPCANDTTIIVKPGRVDTLKLTAPQVDITSAADSIAQALAIKYEQRLEECDNQVKDAYTSGYKASSAYWSSIKIPVKRPDTINHYVRDTRNEIVLTGKLNRANENIANAVDEKEKYRRERNSARMIVGVLVIASIGLTFLKLKA